MAIQAQLYYENLGFPLGGGGGGGGGGNLSQEWMENGCGFNDLRFLNLQQQQQKQQQYQQLQQQFQQQRNQDLGCENGFVMNKSNANNQQPMSIVSQRIAAQMDKQKQEIDRLIALQNERLRFALQEYKKQQLVAILKKYESKSQLLLRQKDEEIAKAANRTMELEEFLRRTEMERQTWQRVAKENEETVINLNNTIEQLKENCCFLTNGGAEDAESCCQTGEEENRRGNEDEENNIKMRCKSCCAENSCVVFLPCRHLCSCKSCDAFLDSCPVCRMVKKASIEVLI